MKVAYVSAPLNQSDPDPDLDWEFFEEASSNFDFKVDKVFWSDSSIQWNEYRLVIIRSPWDYTSQRDKFLEWANAVSAQTQLLNDYQTIEKNTDKRYLTELSKSLSVIPTKFIHPGEVNRAELSQLLLESKAIAVKPNIGAGAVLAGRAESLTAAVELIDKIHQAQRIAMVQPYLSEVDTVGEIAIVILGGEISHAVTKVPALTVGGHGDAQQLIDVTEDMRNFVKQVSQIVENFNDLLYARVDVVPTSSGLMLMELELTEPTLFFPQYPKAAIRMAQLISDRISGSK